MINYLNKLRTTKDELLRSIEIIKRRVNTMAVIERERYVEELLSNPKYNDKKRLERYGWKIYSQYDEDGIIAEIFIRIGAMSRTFVEFGVGNGLENNTLKLLLEGWKGLWIEGDEEFVAQINSKFGDVISRGDLRVVRAYVDRDNVNSLIEPHFRNEVDILSIDIDGNDIHILKSIKVINPRLIVIEYNGKFPPPLSIAQCYNPAHRWTGSDYGGASLVAITKVAALKDYSLVACGIVGVNAFFVRNDLLADKFQDPFTAENHYQPARYFLWDAYISGHCPDWGPYEKI